MAKFSEGFTSCEFAGAIAEAVIHDLRANGFTFSGFPQIDIPMPINEVFKLTLSFSKPKQASVNLEFTSQEAKLAAISFKKGNKPSDVLLKKVKGAIGLLELNLSNNT